MVAYSLALVITHHTMFHSSAHVCTQIVGGKWRGEDVRVRRGGGGGGRSGWGSGEGRM